MKDDNIVSMHYLRDKTVYVPTDAKRFVPKGRFAFLQKWLWSWLVKMGALEDHMDQTVKVEKIEFRKKDFADRLLDAYGACFPNKQPTHVYMGPAEFEELMFMNCNYIQLDFDVKIGYDRKMFGLPVTVVPHMKGCLIV